MTTEQAGMFWFIPVVIYTVRLLYLANMARYPMSPRTVEASWGQLATKIVS